MNLIIPFLVGVMTVIGGWTGYQEFGQQVDTLGAAPFVFTSDQVGTGATNGYVLTTDGDISTWEVAAGGGSSKWTDNGSYITVTTGDFIDVSKIVSTSSTATSTFAGDLSIAKNLLISGDAIADFAGTGLSVTTNTLNAEVQTSDLNAYLLNTGDTATGDYTFDTDGLFVDATGNMVGIGTTTPEYRLSVDGIIQVIGDSRLHSDTVIAGDLDYKIKQNTSDASDNGRLVLQAGGSLSTSRGAYVILEGNEYTNNGRALITSGTGGGGVTITGAAAGVDVNIGPSAGNDFNVDGGKFVVEGDTGNVGIGDATPTSLLTVGNGDLFTINSSGAITGIAGLSGASGAFDGGGFSSFEITNGTAPTVDTTGEIAVDTTSDQLIYYGSATKRVLSFFDEKSVYLASTTRDSSSNTFISGTTTHEMANYSRAVTLDSFYCKTDTGTTSARFGDGTNWTALVECSVSGAEGSSLSNNTFTAREDVQLQVGTDAGSPNKVTVTATFLTTAD